MSWNKRIPTGFIVRRASDKIAREIQALRVIGAVEECNRCFKLVKINNELDAKLTTFVCSSCRLDNQEWDYQKRLGGISYSIGAMVNEMPESELRGDLNQRTQDGY